MTLDERAMIVIDEELTATLAWAARKDVPLTWDRERLELRGDWEQPETGERFYLRGGFDGYRVQPPAWLYTDAGYTGVSDASLYPQLAQSPFGSPMVIKHRQQDVECGVICAPFNRLAYKTLGGPHGDWSMAAWASAGAAGQVRATSVPDMLARIHAEFLYSRGRLA